MLTFVESKITRLALLWGPVATATVGCVIYVQETNINKICINQWSKRNASQIFSCFT